MTMAADAVSWYGMDRRLKTVDHPPVELEQALAIARRYYANAGKVYAGAEEAIAETMFGFTRGRETFIEICVNGVEQISFRYEAPRAEAANGGSLFGALFRPKAFRFETVLASLPDLEARIRDFYALSPAAMQSACAAAPGQPENP
jgi:hypothetical protein